VLLIYSRHQDVGAIPMHTTKIFGGI